MVGELKLHPVDFLFKMAPFAFVLCLFFAGLVDEYGGIKHEYLPVPYSNIFKLMLELFSNGLLAFFLNWTSFSSTKLTSPVTMAVVGNVKQAITIMLSMFLFGQKRTWLNMIGSLLTILGGCLYTYCSIVFGNQDKQEQQFTELSVTSIVEEGPDFTSPLTGKLGNSKFEFYKDTVAIIK